MNTDEQQPTFDRDGLAALLKAPSDPEINVLERCLRALLTLDRAARSRVLEYLDDRLLKLEPPAKDNAEP